MDKKGLTISVTNFGMGVTMRVKLVKDWIIILGVALMTATMVAQPNPAVKAPPEKPEFQTYREKQSYSMGVELLRNLQRQGFDFDLDVVIRGMKDAFAGDKLALTEEDIMENLNIAASRLREQKVSRQLNAGLANKKAEEDFVAQNKTKEGVVTLPSGLQYKIIKDANGKRPSASDSVEVNYRGTLLDGTQFESTYDGGHPATIQVSDPHVIAGLREALKLMPVGAKWQFFIPAQLAYGQRASGKVVGPYSMLVYELELLAIK
jgi:FKBP-type peptidyl-prolyl cis-trans isomerase FklB